MAPKSEDSWIWWAMAPKDLSGQMLNGLLYGISIIWQWPCRVSMALTKMTQGGCSEAEIRRTCLAENTTIHIYPVPALFGAETRDGTVELSLADHSGLKYFLHSNFHITYIFKTTMSVDSVRWYLYCWKWSKYKLWRRAFVLFLPAQRFASFIIRIDERLSTRIFDSLFSSFGSPSLVLIQPDEVALLRSRITTALSFAQDLALRSLRSWYSRSHLWVCKRCLCQTRASSTNPRVMMLRIYLTLKEER